MDSKQSGSAGYAATATRSQGTTLTDAAVRLWPTPATMDVLPARSPEKLADDPKGKDLRRQGSPILSHQVETTPGGETCPVKLNPAFVEWLMGMPRGQTDCGRSATESFHRWWQQHGES